MNSKPGSGKASGAGSGTASGSGSGTGTGSAAGNPMDDPQVARGAYLATGPAACALCYTPFAGGGGPPAPDTTKAFAGGLEFPDTFGTWRSLNITNDPDTGIGKW